MKRPMLLLLVVATLASGEPAQRGLLVACAGDADPAIRQIAERIHAADTPLLAALAGTAPRLPMGDSRKLVAGDVSVRAFNHLIVVGLPDDPLVGQAWQYEARNEAAGWYGFGFGIIAGEVGWLESGFSPWLHSAAIANPPYETQAIVVTGNGIPGVVMAGEALLAHSLVNGLVARPGWTRPHTTLLDRDPLVGDPNLPTWLPIRTGDWTRIALSQCGADVARGILADAGIEPQACWLAKYYRPGVWDEAGGAAARRMYVAGLHRRSFANAVLVVRFSDDGSAAAALPKCTAVANLDMKGAVYTGRGHGLDGEKDSEVPLTAWRDGPWLVFSTLPGGRWQQP